MSTDLDEQEDELLALKSIFDPEEFVWDGTKSSGEIRVCAVLPAEFSVVLKEGGSVTQYGISFLPPLLLTFELPEDYPSSCPPSFTLTCSWLTHTQLAALSAQLIDLYQANGSAVILFSWVQFLREEALTFLDIHSQLELPSDGDKHSAAELKNDPNLPSSDPTENPRCDVNPCKSDHSAFSLDLKTNCSTSDVSSTDSSKSNTVDLSTSSSHPSRYWADNESNADHQKTFPSNVQNQTAQASDVTKPEETEIQDQFSGARKASHLLVAQLNQIIQDDFSKTENISASLPHSSFPDLTDSQGAASLLEDPEDSSQDEDHIFSDLSLTPSQALLSQILIYDASQKQRVFDGTVFDCGVCFLSYLGSECVQLSECGHIFCRACLGEFCKLQITEGNVRNVSCPQADCTATPTPAQVKPLVGQELFARYDRLLLQSTLDSMPDVAYCPRHSCGSAVILDKSSNAAMCSVCDFAFCTTCRKTYHGTDKCQAGRKFENMISQKDIYLPHVEDVAYCPRRSCRTAVILTKFSSEAVCPECNFAFCVICRSAYHGTEECPAGKKVKKSNFHEYLPESHKGMMGLWNDYITGTKNRKHTLESKYGRKILMSTLACGLSDLWIAGNSKPCPHCFCKIQKEEGCNLVLCSRCKQSFCWICLTKLAHRKSGYSHFHLGGCSLHQ
ncbi:E3 ubiquitin-protein ligase RNF14-like [Salarias fasciatus]|uniref:RBR-type E3 ubiquitin transferase n=1 Tax=Salarias fasciatus TaxID=181472 RepID=A0A672I7C8_SALFA|nr:E3 ubiquitin-protein ligase RNF14-like [Salarias fasciatus]